MRSLQKKETLLSDIVILLPVFLGIFGGTSIPDPFSPAFGTAGNSLWSGKNGLLFILPSFFLLFQYVFLRTLSKQESLDGFSMRISCWVLPILSNLIIGMILFTASYRNLSYRIFAMGFGLLFLFLSWVLSHVPQNPIIGIRIPWTLGNLENWNLTHRFGSRCWAVSSLLMMGTALLPAKWCFSCSMLLLLIMVCLPMAYSYSIYRRHKKAGIVYVRPSRAKAGKRMVLWSAILTAGFCILAGILLFTGDISYEFGPDAFRVHASYWSDLELEYDKITELTLYKDCPAGTRVNGFGSLRLSMGAFQNDAFGTYTRYTYTANPDCVVLHIENEVLVLNGADTESTKRLYESLQFFTEP